MRWSMGCLPACGVGIGIERLVMLFTDSASIRDVIMWPFVKKGKPDEFTEMYKEKLAQIEGRKKREKK